MRSIWPITPISLPITVENGGTGGISPTTARAALGLGTVATQNADNVALSGGTVAGLSTPRAAVARTNVQSIPDATDTVVTWEAETYDVGGLFTLASPTRFTIATAGRYLITSCARWAYSAGSNSQLQIWVNGAMVFFRGQGQCYAEAFSIELDLAAADYVQMYVRQESGGSLNFLATNSTFRIHMLL
jgi:hypothetical protein